MVQVGGLIDGRYRVLREIGRGGEGIVYLVLHEQAGQLRAMKVMHAEGDSRALQEELRILRSLHHSMLPEIVDVIFCEEECCLVMQYIEGDTLEQIARRGVSLKEATVWGIRLCELLQYMHSRPVPVYHYDLKPSNIILDAGKQLFLVDFGSARSVYAGRRTGEESPQTGTPGYAAPELYETGAACDGRADIYSVGAVLFYLLCGRKPYTGMTAAQCLDAMCAAGIRDGQDARGLAKILASCLQVSAAGRPADCRSLRQQLWLLSGAGKLQSQLRLAGERLHLAAGILSTVCLLMALLCFSASAGMRSRVYAADLQRAGLTEGREKLRLLTEAVTLFPEREEPYLEIIEAMTQDGRFTTEESAQMTEILYKRSMGRMAENIQYLYENEDAYLQVSYRLGLAYYFLTGVSGDKSAAAGWLAQAADEELVCRCADSAQAAEICREAEILLDLCEYYSMRVTFSGSRQEPEPAELWAKLTRLLAAGKENSSDSEWLLQEWLHIFYDNMDLLRKGVGEKEIDRTLEEVRKQLPVPGKDGQGPGEQTIEEFYEYVVTDWNILQGVQSSKGEGE